MGRTSLAIAVLVCALLGAFWVWQDQSTSQTEDIGLAEDNNPVVSQSSDNSISGASDAKSPFSTKPLSTNNEQTVSSQLAENIRSANDSDTETSDTFIPVPIDVTTLGRKTISDAEFLQIADTLRRNPALLQQVIDEFRQETDINRRAELARLLGEVGGESLTLVASELIYSGDAESRLVGLQLLQQIQPGNDEAREIASSLLATEVEPDILVGTLTALARPDDVDENSRQFLSEQVAYLTDHESASVRNISLDILSRWSKDGQYTEVLRKGLYDQESVVRESAAYALVGHENVSPILIESLLSVAVDSSEGKRARSGAILALESMPIDSETRQKVEAAQLELNTIRR